MFDGWLGGDLMVVWQWSGVCLAGGFQDYWACGLDGFFQARNPDALPNTIPTAFQQSPKQLAKPPTDNLKLPATCLQTVCKPPSKSPFKPTFKHRPNNPVPQCLPRLTCMTPSHLFAFKAHLGANIAQKRPFHKDSL